MTANKTRMQTTLVVDNLSPFTPDIVTCLNKLGANYIQKSFSSLTNVTISSNDDNNCPNYKYHGHNPGGNAYILNKSKVLGDGANYDKKNNNDSRDIIDTTNNTDKTNNTNNIKNNLFCDKVILSGRRMNNREINIVNSSIIRQCFENNIPLLGICYGAEILALTLGGTIRKMAMPVQDTISLTVSKTGSLISVDMKTLLVYESHKYCVAKLPEDFESLASSIHCGHEIFSHKEKKLFGTQFHPEKSGPDGLKLLSNFLSI
ncbi:MAG: gamma-glutamyl-gamma-aminobutyrate hydrolase family protein [Thermoproteota archaeon]|nr:gamma-glutamyl-gamma-aminobutyrate hydrolase family protein [Thermoproteota archaeon]